MGYLSRLITFIGLILLAHAGYSAHEHTLLSSNVQLNTSIPPDIVLEALVSIITLSIGIVLGAPALKPISWSQWAGQIEREGGARNPFRRLEERYGFWDVRTKRKVFADWVRGQPMKE